MDSNISLILPFVIHGCEAWSATLREEYFVKVFENRVQTRIFEGGRK
jgi:hypothetical protein